MNAKRNYIVLCLGLTLALFVSFRTQAVAETAAMTSPVVMVCEHGTVKSLMAVFLFDQESKQRGLPFRAISRGVVPDEKVPGKIAEALSKDGFDISGFEPRKLLSRDVAKSSRVVAIGADLSAFQSDAAATILQWNDVPPASVDYEAAKTSLLAHIHALLDELEKQQH